jgi:hypothetical protein
MENKFVYLYFFFLKVMNNGHIASVTFYGNNGSSQQNVFSAWANNQQSNSISGKAQCSKFNDENMA